MDAALKRRLMFWLTPGLLLAAALIWLFYPRAVAVDIVRVTRGPLQVTVSGEGETRVHDMFVVSAPVAGFMRRIQLEPGDRVTAGKTVIARIDPVDPGLLDARTVASGRAAIDAAAFARNSAQAELRRMRADSEYAVSELRRAETLAETRAISNRDLEAARRAAKAAAAALEQARANLKMRESEYQRAQAQLWSPEYLAQSGAADAAKASGAGTVLVRSPGNGAVLRVLARSEGFVQSGAPLVELGDAGEMEIEVDLLSADAVKVQAGQRVSIEAWGGDAPLAGKVRQVEPFGFTKISALGIEEQRVRVIIDFTEPRERWRSLGHGYRVEPRIVTWESTDALQAPLSSLFREGDDWAVFLVVNGRAETRRVTIGHQNGLSAEITAGLEPGEQVVSYPDDRIAPGTRLTQRVSETTR